MHRKSRLTLVMMAILLMVGMVGIQPAKPVQAALPTDLFFSEYIEGGGQNKAIEIYNGTGLPVDLSDYRLELYSNGASAPTANATLSGTLVTGDVFVVSRSDADPAIVAQADLLNSTVVSWNGDDAIALRKISTGLLVDAFGQIGYRPASGYWGTNPIVTMDRTLVRKANICAGDPDGSNAFDPATEWDMYPKDTVAYIGSHTSNCAPQPPVINEFSASTTGDDVEFVEIFGSPNTDYSAYTILEIEGDFNSTNNSEGFVDEVIALGTTDANGFLLVSLLNGALENGTISLLLVKDNTATLDVDIDTDDNGVIDATYWSEITDGVAVKDSDAADLTYATPTLGVAYDGLSFAPGGASRIPDGTDTDTTADWVRNDFDLAGIPGFAGTIATGEAYNTPGATNRAYVETAPSVVSTIPANGGNHPIDENITITFSEKVTVTDPWFSISCGTSGAHTATVNDLDPVFVLNPDVDFTIGESCTITITAANVVDDDADDATFNAMLADYSFSFTAVTPPERCGDPFTHTYDIQGTGETSPLAGTILATEGVVVGDFQVGGKNGYYIQDLSGDGNPATSDGIFVYNTTTAVNPGDHVRVRGTAVEFSGITEISPVTQVWVCSTGNTVVPTEVTLPVSAVSDFEKYESMLVTFPQSLIISEYFNYDRFGEIVLTSTRHMTPTALVEPGAPAQAEAAAYLLDRITLDDGRTNQNPDPAIHPNGLTFNMTNLFRGGATVTDATGILDFYQSLYRLQPTTGATYADVNARTAAPDITEADLKVTSFNVLNYFVTLDDGTHDICGPDGIQECRGADDSIEFDRQKAKIVAALAAIDADVYGLMEIENDSPVAGNDAVADLVAGLNLVAGAGTYAYIDTGAIGGDAIKQAILYKPAAVTPVGAYKILDSTVDPRFIDDANRPVLAQAFTDNVTGVEFVVAVNHLKSKGSACVGDPDLGDGAGNCNLTRLAAAQALVDWLANPTYFPDVEKTLIIGDLNSYDKEDPIDAIKLGADDAAGTADDYLDMIDENIGEFAYGYVYDGQMGYLDHALANLAMAEQIVDVNFWHINADEARLIDYDMSFKAPAQDALYVPDAYRSSDHDPVIVTLSFAPLSVTNVDLLQSIDPLTIETTATALPGNLTDGFTMALDPAIAWYYFDTDTITSTRPLADGSYPFYLDGTTTEVFTLVVNGTDYFLRDTYANDGTPLRVQGAFPLGTYTYVGEVADDYGFTDEVSLTITFVAPLAVTDVALVQSPDLSTWTPIEGSLAEDYTLNLDPLVEYYYLDAESITSNRPLADGSYPFYMTSNPGAGFYAYWAERGVVEGATGWQALMWAIINGDAPMFYLKVEGTTLTLIDGLQGDPNPLRVNGGYYPGLYTFHGVVADQFGFGDVLDVSILFNHIPVAQDQEVTTVEDTAIQITLAASDVDGDPLTYSIASQPAHGTVTLVGNIATYTPALDFFGEDSFTFTANDGTVNSNPATVTITVTDVKDQVVAVDDAYSTNEDTTLTVAAPGVLANDLDADGNQRVASLVTDVQHGSLSLLGDGSFIYTPDANFFGIDTFVYKLITYPAPESLWTDEATVTITVNPIVDAPVLGLIPDATIPEMVEFSFTATATDVDLPPQTLTFSLVGAPASAAITAGGVFTWTPSELQGPGEFTFTVKVCDDTAPTPLCDEQEVTLTVTEVNTAPVASDISETTDEDVAVDVTLVATDAQGDTLTYTILDQPIHGDVVLVGNIATYTPDPDFNGEDSFTYKANDGLVDSDMAVVTITVTPVNDAPVAVEDAYTTNEDTTLEVAAPGVLSNDTDIDGDTLTAILVADVSNGALTLAADGSFVYTPDENYFGPDSFTYKASDSTLESNTVTVTLTITSVNDWVVANDDEYETPAGVTLEVAAPGVLVNDVLLDPQETVVLDVLVQPTGGTLTLNVDGSFTYVPNAGFFGVDTFEYQLNSTLMLQGEFSDTAIVTIKVTARQLFLPLILR